MSMMDGCSIEVSFAFHLEINSAFIVQLGLQTL